MDIKMEIKENILCVGLSGEIDHHTCATIKTDVDQIYQSNRVTHILFDFENVTFMDSSGVGLLMGRYRNALMSGGKVVMVKVRPEVDKIMKLSGIYKLITNYSDEKDAIAHL